MQAFRCSVGVDLVLVASLTSPICSVPSGDSTVTVCATRFLILECEPTSRILITAALGMLRWGSLFGARRGARIWSVLLPVLLQESPATFLEPVSELFQQLIQSLVLGENWTRVCHRV